MENNFSSGDDEEIVREICEKFSDLNFIYRAHPNLKLIKNQQTFDIEKLKDIPNLRVFDQYSKISTYDLIKFSDKIIVFKSTIGVEANYFGKPVISIGPNWYQYLDIAYKPKNIEELKKILYTKSLKSKLKEDSIKYGYYILTRGKELNKNSKDLDLNIKFSKVALIFTMKLISLSKLISFQKIYLYLKSINDSRVRNKINEFLKI